MDAISVAASAAADALVSAPTLSASPSRTLIDQCRVFLQDLPYQDEEEEARPGDDEAEINEICQELYEASDGCDAHLDYLNGTTLSDGEAATCALIQAISSTGTDSTTDTDAAEAEQGWLESTIYYTIQSAGNDASRSVLLAAAAAGVVALVAWAAKKYSERTPKKTGLLEMEMEPYPLDGAVRAGEGGASDAPFVCA